MNEQALKERLKSLATTESRTFQEVWKELILERFLVRLAHSEYHEKFIFKGGLLLSHYLKIGRETTDADFLAVRLQAERNTIEKAATEICTVTIKDGFQFSFSDIEQLEPQQANYPGFRVNLDVALGGMKDRIQVDIAMGDTVEPKQESFKLYQYRGKPIFEGSISLRVYPVETIFAEKLETVIVRGAANSRMKDFHDLVLLCRERGLLDAVQLKKDVIRTFANRTTQLVLPIAFTADEFVGLQRLWAAHLRGLADIAIELRMPEQIDQLVSEVNQWLIENKITG